MPDKIIALVYFAFIAASLHAQVFFVAPLAEAVYYGRHTPAIFYGGIIGADGGVTIGIRFAYGQSTDEESRLTMLEFQFLARLYPFDFANAKGLFVQFNGGPVLFFSEGDVIKIPAEIGTFSAGLTVGWRFVLGKHFFIDPYIRVGYPYLYGGGISAGVRF